VEVRVTARELPVEFVTDRFYVRPITEDGHEVRLYTDTGGGLFVTPATALRLGLQVETIGDGDERIGICDPPTWRGDAAIPDLSADADPRPPDVRGKLFVYDAPVGWLDADGLLGQVWFGGRCWTFDYLGGRLAVDGVPPADADVDHVVTLGFPVGDDGRRSTHFPSIEASVDGVTSGFLFDTGAMVSLTDRALDAFGGEARDRGTSFVVGSIFDRWRTRHPDWPVVEGADRNADSEPMIQVPAVTIAGHTVGPVWWTRRPDANFHDYMSSMMDRRVDGALGGSLFRYFTIHVDYPNARASFVR
jgi:hypothetical protein